MWLENDHPDSLAKSANMRTSNANRLVIRLVMLALTIERNESICVDEKKKLDGSYQGLFERLDFSRK